MKKTLPLPLLFVACTPYVPTPDSGTPDAGVTDAGTADAGVVNVCSMENTACDAGSTLPSGQCFHETTEDGGMAWFCEIAV